MAEKYSTPTLRGRLKDANKAFKNKLAMKAMRPTTAKAGPSPQKVSPRKSSAASAVSATPAKRASTAKTVSPSKPNAVTGKRAGMLSGARARMRSRVNKR